MQYRRAGNSGLKVSAVGLGTNNFGGRTEEDRSIAVIHRALDLGVTTIDTADSYSKGRSEEIIGRALHGRRYQAQILTKVNKPMGAGPHDRGLSRTHIIAACEASLRRLQTDFIDLYQMHDWDPETPLEESLRAFDDLVRAGKVRYIGCSNFAAWQLVLALWTSDKRGYVPFVSVQPEYNMFERTVEAELLPACEALGAGIIPYFPLASGLLTGKYRAGEPVPEGTRFYGSERLRQQLTDERLEKVAQLEEIARAHGKTVGQLAIAWLLARPVVCTVIAGATRPEQVEENAGAAEWQLDAATLQAIESILG
ncbi:MAG TPA: aldo/keto reductase [Chloroflexota bacterium]|nr:aldo/keto reductase [Chloroflexota bacterium]